MLNLGGLFFTLDANTRGLMQSKRDIQDFARSVDQAFRGLSQGNVSNSFANGLLRQEKAVLSMLERVKDLQDRISSSGIKTKGVDNIFKDVSAAYNDFARKMNTPVPLNAAQFSRTVSSMRNQLKDLEREFNQTQNAFGRSGGFMNFTGVLKGLGGASLLVQGHLGGMSTRFFALTALVKEFGIVAAATAASVAGLSAGIALLGGAAIKSGRELQGLVAGFTAITGNTAVARVELGYVKTVADQAGIAFNETAKSFLKYLAAAQSGGLTVKQTQDTFRGVALAAATMQLSVDDTAGTFRALEQMLSKGTVQAEELRGQLGDRLPGAFNIAAVAMGKTTAQLGAMMKKGEVISADFVPKFVTALQRMWNIDPSKPINTLTASLNRLSNEWTYFGQSLDQATGATIVYKNLVDGLITGLQSLSANLPQIISWIGALTGAFIGLGTAMAVTALIQWISSLAPLVNWIGIVVRSTNLWTAAQVLLNAAMAANPIGGIITLILTLTAAVGGAYVGYNLLNNAVQQNMAAMNNTSGIEAYISQQKKLGFAVRSTTEEMIKQVMVMNKLATERATQANIAANKAAEGPGFTDYVSSFFSQRHEGKGIVYDSPGAIAKKRADDANKDATEAVAEARRTADLYVELQNLLKLPEPPSTPVDPVGKKGKTKKLTDDIDRIEDYILKMQDAEARLARLGEGNRNYKLVDDLFKAKEALNQLNPKQVAKVDQALRAAGYSSGTLEARLGAVFTRTREAEEAARAFVKIWDDLDSGKIQLDTLGKQLKYLQTGGDPRMLDVAFEPAARAKDALRDINTSTKSGQDALRGLSMRMEELGFYSSNTGDLLEDTTNQLTGFYNEGIRGERMVRVMSQLYTETQRLKDSLAEYSAMSSALGGSIRDNLFGDPEETARSVQEAVRRGQAVRDLVKELVAAGDTQEVANQKGREYLDVLRQMDDASRTYDKLREKADLAHQSLKDVVSAGTGAFRDWISGVKSLGDALNALSKDILDVMWKQFIDAPINDVFKNLGKKRGDTAATGVDSVIAGLAANDNTKSLDLLGIAAANAANIVQGNFTNGLTSAGAQIGTLVAGQITQNAVQNSATTAMVQTTGAFVLVANAARAAAAALASVAATGDGADGLSSVGSLLGSIFSAGGGAKGGLSSIGSTLGGLFSKAPGRALGGNMLAGNMYEINEPGVTGEYFIPRVNGYMSNTNPNAAGNTHVDASTYIDARGATPDAVAALREEMRQRDAHLRETLPYVIDARVQDSSNRRRYG